MFVQYASQPGNDIDALTAVMKRRQPTAAARDAGTRDLPDAWW